MASYISADDKSAMRKSAPIGELFAFFAKILSPERDFYVLAIIYGVGISLLSLATPISVQMLINTVAYTGLPTPLIVLSLTLFGLLLVSGLLNALRHHLMEIFGRRFYARMVSEITLRAIYAQNPFFHDASRSALFNRYFDIVTVQKAIPSLLIGGFALVLQAGVGFALVSLYHPLFLAFNVVFMLLIWAVWLMWGRSAIRAAIDLSHLKHAAAGWIEGLGASNGFFKSERHIAYALGRTDDVTRDYVNAHRAHFRQHFAQTVSFYVIYAAASATLLGLGGWLVIQGQLTLGQLVAAELILSAVFFSVSQLGVYLNVFYDLCAAVEELSLFYSVVQEEPTGTVRLQRENTDLVFANVKGQTRSGEAKLNFTIESGSTVMAIAGDHGVQRLMTHLLKRHVETTHGYVSLGGADIRDTDAHILRQEIIVLDRSTIIETTIRNYLYLSADQPTPEKALKALDIAGLDKIVSRLEGGLDANIASTGWPLSVAETMQLKLAAAVLAQPRVLILNQLFDLVPQADMARSVKALRGIKGMTLIYFTNRQVDLGFDRFLLLGETTQQLVDAFDDFRAARVDETSAINLIAGSG